MGKLHGAALASWRKKHGKKNRRRSRRSSSSSSSRAVVRHVHHHPKKHGGGGRRRRRFGGGGAFESLASARVLIPVAALAAAYGYSGQTMPAFADALRKIPGVKTFGAPLVIGGVALGINRFVYANKWLRLVAAVGLTLAAYQWGKTEFAIPEWTGDVGDVADVT